MRRSLTLLAAVVAMVTTAAAQWNMEPLRTDTPMVHDPVMAYEGGKYYIFATGRDVQMWTSPNRRTWTLHRMGALDSIPHWTRDSVPGFMSHVWAPDVIRYRDQWWMAYSCSTFGRNTSAIGLAARRSLADIGQTPWRDCGPIVCSREGRDPWNAIDPAFFLDAAGLPWLVWGSFWDGIQVARLDTSMHIARGYQPRTIARRIAIADTLKAEENPTSKFAGRNAIEAPFIFHHEGYYYLFVSHDYCCRGMKSNYKVVVGRSRLPEGPYLDDRGRDMAEGGGRIVIEGDKIRFEAAGHCAAYHFQDGDLFICHGYSTAHNGQSILIQQPISWSPDGWPMLLHMNIDHW